MVILINFSSSFFFQLTIRHVVNCCLLTVKIRHWLCSVPHRCLNRGFLCVYSIFAGSCFRLSNAQLRYSSLNNFSSFQKWLSISPKYSFDQHLISGFFGGLQILDLATMCWINQLCLLHTTSTEVKYVPLNIG